MSENKEVDLGCMLLKIKKENGENILLCEVRDKCLAVSEDVKARFGELLKNLVAEFNIKHIKMINSEEKNVG